MSPKAVNQLKTVRLPYYTRLNPVSYHFVLSEVTILILYFLPRCVRPKLWYPRCRTCKLPRERGKGKSYNNYSTGSGFDLSVAC